jgi:hypothetical protein
MRAINATENMLTPTQKQVAMKIVACVRGEERSVELFIKRNCSSKESIARVSRQSTRTYFRQFVLNKISEQEESDFTCVKNR